MCVISLIFRESLVLLYLPFLCMALSILSFSAVLYGSRCLCTVSAVSSCSGELSWAMHSAHICATHMFSLWRAEMSFHAWVSMGCVRRMIVPSLQSYALPAQKRYPVMHEFSVRRAEQNWYWHDMHVDIWCLVL